MGNNREWLLKAIVVIIWFSSGAHADIFVAEQINECKCIKQMSLLPVW